MASYCYYPPPGRFDHVPAVHQPASSYDMMYAPAVPLAPPPPPPPSLYYGPPVDQYHGMYWQQQQQQCHVQHHQQVQHHHVQQPAFQPIPPAPMYGAISRLDDESNSGGVSVNLDYQFSDMAEFICTMTHGILFTGPYKWSLNELSAFKRFLVHVLTATRLPRPTIVLALVYISKRWALIGHEHPRPCTDMVYKMAVVGLVLANKLHDDNTFTNQSWYKATHIPVGEITVFEADWLRDIQWGLHLSNADVQAWFKWDECWQMFIKTRVTEHRHPSPVLETPVYESTRMERTTRKYPADVSPIPMIQPPSPLRRQSSTPRWMVPSPPKPSMASDSGVYHPWDRANRRIPAPVMPIQPFPTMYNGPPGLNALPHRESRQTPWHVPVEKKTDWFSVAAC